MVMQRRDEKSIQNGHDRESNWVLNVSSSTRYHWARPPVWYIRPLAEGILLFFNQVQAKIQATWGGGWSQTLFSPGYAPVHSNELQGLLSSLSAPPPRPDPPKILCKQCEWTWLKQLQGNTRITVKCWPNLLSCLVDHDINDASSSQKLWLRVASRKFKHQQSYNAKDRLMTSW